MRVGFIGLGNMGTPLVRRLTADHQLVVYDRDPAALACFEATGTVTAGSVSDLARGTDTVLTCLPTSAHLEVLVAAPHRDPHCHRARRPVLLH